MTNPKEDIQTWMLTGRNLVSEFFFYFHDSRLPVHSLSCFGTFIEFIILFLFFSYQSFLFHPFICSIISFILFPFLVFFVICSSWLVYHLFFLLLSFIHVFLSWLIEFLVFSLISLFGLLIILICFLVSYSFFIGFCSSIIFCSNLIKVTFLRRSNVNVVGNTNCSRKDIQSIAQGRDGLRLRAEGLSC